MQKGWGKMVKKYNLQLWPKPENIADIHDKSNKIEITYFTPQMQWTGIVEMFKESGRELETQSVSPRSWVLRVLKLLSSSPGAGGPLTTPLPGRPKLVILPGTRQSGGWGAGQGVLEWKFQKFRSRNSELKNQTCLFSALLNMCLTSKNKSSETFQLWKTNLWTPRLFRALPQNGMPYIAIGMR